MLQSGLTQSNPSCFFSPVYHPRMKSTGREGRRTTWLPNARGTPAGWRRTRSQWGRRSWSVRTRRCGRRWQSYGRSAAASRTSWVATKPNSDRCKGPRVACNATVNGHLYSRPYESLGFYIRVETHYLTDNTSSVPPTRPCSPGGLWRELATDGHGYRGLIWVSR